MQGLYPVIKPIKDAVNLSELKQEVEYEYAQLLAKAKPLKGNLYIIPHDALSINEPTPSILSMHCIVAMMIKVRMGLIVTKDALKSVAQGTVIHRRYEEWFRNVNRHLTVYTEMRLTSDETVGVPDIVYCSQDECGLIELKATWQVNDARESAYIRQMAMYYDMLKDFNITESYLVTMNDVKLIPVRMLKEHVKEAKEILNAVKGNYPQYPPDARLCVNCSLKPVCPPYRNLADKLLFG